MSIDLIKQSVIVIGLLKIPNGWLTKNKINPCNILSVPVVTQHKVVFQGAFSQHIFVPQLCCRLYKYILDQGWAK